MYLQTDFKTKKLEIKDRYSKRFYKLRQEVVSNSQLRFFPLSYVRNARYRFQPHRLSKMPSLRRGARL